MTEAEKSDYALAVYNDTRSEIRERIGYRDKWIGQYVFGVVVFLGVALGLKDVPFDIKIMLCLVMPFISLIVAINVSAHVKSVEALADFLREHLSPFFEKAGVSHWDGLTKTKRDQNDAEEIKRNNRRLWTHIASLHLPTAMSLAVAAILISREYDADWQHPLSIPLPVALFCIALMVFGVAVFVSWESFASRRGDKAAAEVAKPPVPAKAPTVSPPTTNKGAKKS